MDQLLDSSTLADKDYVGLGLLTPTKRRPGIKMPAAHRGNNRRIHRLRSVVERVIAQVKTWRVLHSGFRRPLRSYGRVFSVVRSLIFFVASDPLWISLNNLSATFETGKLYWLAGENGVGKTTLLELTANLRQPKKW